MIYVYECLECQHKQEETSQKTLFCPMCANYRGVWRQMILAFRKPGEQDNDEVSEEGDGKA